MKVLSKIKISLNLLFTLHLDLEKVTGKICERECEQMTKQGVCMYEDC